MSRAIRISVCLIVFTVLAASAVTSQELHPVGDEASQVIKQCFEYDRNVSLDARVVETVELENCVREKIVFTGNRQSRVPGYLAFPKNAKKPCPVVLQLHGFSASKLSWWENFTYGAMAQTTERLLSEGYAVLALDALYHGERIQDYDYGNLWSIIKKQETYKYMELVNQSVIEYRRALDYLDTRGDIDMSRIGATGPSMGGIMTFYLSAVEPRITCAVSCVVMPLEPLNHKRYLINDPTNAASAICCPLLMLMGKKDEWYTMENGNALFDLVGSKEKNIIWYDSGHSLPVEHVNEIVKWFDKYL